MRRLVVVGVTLVLAMSACGDEGSGGGDTMEPGRAPSATSPAPSESPAEEESPVPDDPEAVAIADLADRAGVPEDEIEVVSHDEVTWRDGSLGCPEPGMSYTQALVDGYRIVLRVDGQDVAYHGAAGGAPTRCDDPDPDGAVPNPNT